MGNPVSFASRKPRLFALAFECCRCAPEQRRFNPLERVDADHSIETAFYSARDERNGAAPGADAELGGLGSERVRGHERRFFDDHFERPGRTGCPDATVLMQNEQVQARAGISEGSGTQVSLNEMFLQWQLPLISIARFPDFGGSVSETKQSLFSSVGREPTRH